MRISLPSGTPAAFARPDGEPTMGLVIATDIFGLRPLYDDLAARLAEEWQMSVCAVEPFPGRDLGADIGPRSAVVSTIDDGRHLADLEAAATELVDRTGVSRVGLMGFCLGGMYCHKAARSDRFDRIVSFYGMIRVPADWRSATQAEPLEILASGHADRVLAVIGELDPYTPPDDVDALERLGVATVRYPEAEHGFAHDPARPSHRAGDAADAFARSRAWLLG